MKKIIFALIALFSIHNASHAQEVILSTGGTVTATGSVSYSVGQVFYTSTIESSGSVLLGVQQSIELLSLSTEEVDLLKNSTTFPNPTKDVFALKLQNIELDGLQYVLIDTNGKILQRGKIKSNNTYLNIQPYSTGVYFLRVQQRNKFLKTFKILKN
ncbi:MAG: hypothetical protein CMB99_08650 [Flavobacteriaceae bacterium]|nr:hypothetical protein [Flavobacteriaceae bacterium]|tara:strand:- start:17221 stop:17691 length:471 start_codon:yes stop_codon:yes gene_type:complete